MSEETSHSVGASRTSVKSRKPHRTVKHAEQINHASTVGDSISQLYSSKHFSDVTLVVQGVHFPAHRVILAARSEYFRALLYGGLVESSSSLIPLNGITAKSFKHLLKYVYTGKLRIRRIQVMLEVLGLAHQYHFDVLQKALSAHLTHRLRTTNVWVIYDVAVMYNLDDLVNACVRFLDAFVAEPLKSPHFLRLSEAAVGMLLSRDSFCAPEIEIFRSLLSWLRASSSEQALDNTDDDAESVCKTGASKRETIDKAQCNRLLDKCIRFERISVQDLLDEVRTSGMVDPDRLLDAITRQVYSPASISHRGWLVPNVNLATRRFGCCLVSGEQGCYPYFFVDSDPLKEADGDAEAEGRQVTPIAGWSAQGTLADRSAEATGQQEAEEEPAGGDGEDELDEDGESEDTVQEENDCLDGEEGYPTVATAAVYQQQQQQRVSDSSDPSATTAVPANISQGFPTETSNHPRQSGLQGLDIPMATGSRAPAGEAQGPRAGESTASSLLGLVPLQEHRRQQPAATPVSHRLPAAGRCPCSRQPTPHSEHDVVRHSIDDPCANITIRLGRPSIVNTIRMQLWDLEVRSYSYGVEVSLDGVAWQMVADYHNHLCRSWQTLHFRARVVHFIRIRGSQNTANRTFHLVTFRCLYTDQPCRQVDGFLVPNYNVASVEHGAAVLEGVSRHRNALIDGNARLYDWNSGYTCHQLGNGAIVIQLAQPFMLSSMRFLLWDLDDRTYGYSVYVSTNWDQWRRVRDASREFRQSWQVIRFPLQLVTYIRVVGTHNSANEVFHLVHLECPYPPAEVEDTMEDQLPTADRDAELPPTRREAGSSLTAATVPVADQTEAPSDVPASSQQASNHQLLPSTSQDSMASPDQVPTPDEAKYAMGDTADREPTPPGSVDGSSASIHGDEEGEEE